MLKFLSRTLAVLAILLCVSTAHAQKTRVVVVPLFGDDAASKWRGPWVTDTAYKKSEIIEFGGSSYIAVLDHQSALSNIPPEARLWDLVAASGANGAAGNQGLPGDQGNQGLPGDQGIPGDKGEQGIQGDKGEQGTAADAVAAICVALGSTAGCDLVKILAPDISKRVFVTSTVHGGNLGGLDGADGICEARAEEQNLKGVFKAWLSSTTAISADSRVTHSLAPYILVDGTEIASNYEDLIDGTLTHSISLDESGDLVATSPHEVWTGTLTDGQGSAKGYDCDGWTTSGGDNRFGLFGRVDRTDAGWTDGGLIMNCSSAYHLYCFQQ